MGVDGGLRSGKSFRLVLHMMIQLGGQGSLVYGFLVASRILLSLCGVVAKGIATATGQSRSAVILCGSDSHAIVHLDMAGKCRKVNSVYFSHLLVVLTA